MTYTRETINEYLKEHKKALEQENWLLANAPADDFAEMIEQLIEEVERYKTFIEQLASMDTVDTSHFVPYSMGYAVALHEIKRRCQEILNL